MQPELICNHNQFVSWYSMAFFYVIQQMNLNGVQLFLYNYRTFIWLYYIFINQRQKINALAFLHIFCFLGVKGVIRHFYLLHFTL